MNSTRLRAKLAGQPAIAQRIFEAVPINEVWQTIEIYNELRRCGSARDVRVVEGNLNLLKSAGLVVEPSKGHWRRVKVSDRTAPVSAETTSPPSSTQPETTMNETPKPLPVPVKPAATQAPAKPLCALDYLAPLVSRVNKIASDLAELSSAIETAALEIEQQVADSATAAQTLAQLRTLLNPTMQPK